MLYERSLSPSLSLLSETEALLTPLYLGAYFRGMLYFVAFAAVSCFYIDVLSPKIIYLTSTGTGVYYGVVQIAQLLQMFVLGPRLILNVRAYHAKLVSRSDEGIGMATIAFQERGKV
ncbi:hypothetical protein DFH29DRAFT_1005695 [Suillus ampliporus]|nr:hypothetical protein DFH29DRAFT_1005695 [Suillus ampliporus]